LLKKGWFSLNIQNSKNDTSLFSLGNIKILSNIFADSINYGRILKKITAESAFMSLTIIYCSYLRRL